MDKRDELRRIFDNAERSARAYRHKRQCEYLDDAFSQLEDAEQDSVMGKIEGMDDADILDLRNQFGPDVEDGKRLLRQL